MITIPLIMYANVRYSLEGPLFKEKMRLRSYGTPEVDSTVYRELKKKFKKVGYKPRIATTPRAMPAYLVGGTMKVADSGRPPRSWISIGAPISSGRVLTRPMTGRPIAKPKTVRCG